MMKKIIFVTMCAVLMMEYCVSSAQTVVLDYYFNHETHKSQSGDNERFHYTWEDKENTGFSILGDVFKKNGFQLKSLEAAPTVDHLKGANVYIIVDPDTKKENPSPNYIEKKDIDQTARWVEAGGILIMFANDSANVELPHFNNLAAKFGMHFNNDLQNHVIDDDHFDAGGISTIGNPVFKSPRLIFMKDVCSISTNRIAHPLLKNEDGATIIAVAKYGKGMVMAVGDPWLYNEYTNGRLPAKFENDKAADDLAEWLHKMTRL